MIRYTVEMSVNRDGKKTFDVIKYIEQGAGLVPVCTVDSFTTWAAALYCKTQLTNEEIIKERYQHEEG